MIIPSGAVRVLMATRPVDFRKGMDGLAALGRESLGSDPYSGVIYVFRAKRADRVKLLLWDGTGLVLVAKRLEKSSFRWLKIEPETAEVFWCYERVGDPYGVLGQLPEAEWNIGREYFARSPGSDIWVSFDDIPEAIRDALWSRVTDDSENIEAFMADDIPF